MNDDDRKRAAEAYGEDAIDRLFAMLEPKPKRPRDKKGRPLRDEGKNNPAPPQVSRASRPHKKTSRCTWGRW